MYDPKFTQKEMYDQYGRSRPSNKKVDPKPSRGSGFSGMGPDPAEKFGGSPTKGLGSKPFERGSTYDVIPTFPKDDKPEPPTRFVDTVKNKAVELFKFFGGDDPKDTEVDPSKVYRGPMFRGPINPGVIEARIRDAVDYSKAPPLFYSGIPNEGNMRYDVVPPASANKNLMKNSINSLLQRVAPNSKEYTIKRGDTLSQIAEKEGVSVADLAKVNKIDNVDLIIEGETIVIPKPQEMERAKDFVDSVDPDAQFSQSGVPMDQRIFEPEDLSDLNNPQTRQGLMSTSDRPDVTVTELAPVMGGYDEVPQTITEGLGANPNTKNVRNLYKKSQATQLKAAQTILKQKGYYQGQPIDGVTGKNTETSLKSFQYNNGIPVTGELNDETKLALARGNSINAVAATRSSDAMLANISEGEGSYGAANNGTSSLADRFRVSGSYYSDTYNKPLVEMTINEILNAQTGNTGLSTEELLAVDATTEEAQRNREMFAVGAYQIIPETMQAAISAGIVSGDEKFTPSVQDNIATKYLAGSKRENLRDYIQGKSGVTLNQAVADMAKEWASYPVPEDTYNDEGVLIARQGESRYGSGNQAQHDLEATKQMLRNARERYLAGIENI